eukprot:2906817-Lingulodinium_polyedra.AAC.1
MLDALGELLASLFKSLKPQARPLEGLTAAAAAGQGREGEGQQGAVEQRCVEETDGLLTPAGPSTGGGRGRR